MATTSKAARTKKTSKDSAPPSSRRGTKSTRTREKKGDGVGHGAATLTNPDKVLFPRDGITKREIVEYYRAIAPVMIPHLTGRPLAIQRWPDGIDAFMWYQQKAPPKVPPFVRLIPIADRKHVCVDNEEALAWLANLAALTLHQWSSHAPATDDRTVLDAELDRPDYVIFDLDPGEGTWAHLIEVALAVRKVLDELELESVVKTSGKRGLHVVVPLARTHDYPQVAAFAESVADGVAEALPAIATTERMKAKRHGRLYVDAMQNGRGKTIVAPYTIRALDGAPVSTPLRWEEVTTKLDPSKLGMRQALARVEKHGDLFAPVLHGRAKLPR